MFNFKNELLQQYQQKRVENFIKIKIEELEKIKKELQANPINNELMFIKCSEFTECIKAIMEAQKEIKARENKEKEGK